MKKKRAFGNISQIKAGAVLSYITIAFNILTGIVYTPWMIRQIGKSDYGLFILATSFLSYFIMDFGLGNAIARFTTMYKTRNEKEQVNNLLGLALKLYLLLDIIILVVLVVLYFFIENVFVKLHAEELAKFKIVFCIVGLFSLISFPALPLNGILTAFERFIVLKFSDLFNKVLTVILMIAALYFGYKLYALVIINTIVGILLIVVKLVYISRTTDIKINYRYRNKSLVKELFSYSVWVSVVGIAQRLLSNITPSILAIFSGTTQIAIFAVGSNIENYVWLFASALNGLFLPRLYKLSVKSDNMDEINALLVKVGRIQLAIVGLLIIGFVSLGKEFLGFWIGKDFTSSYYVVIFLIVPGLVIYVQQIAYTLIYVVNKVKLFALIYLGASVLSGILSAILAPHFGAIGSAAAICTTYLLVNIIGLNIFYSKILKLDIKSFFKKCHLKMLPALTIALATGFLLQLIHTQSLIAFITKCGFLCAVYAAAIWLFSLNNEEKMLARSMTKFINRQKT